MSTHVGGVQNQVICLKNEYKKTIGIRHLWEARRGMTWAGAVAEPGLCVWILLLLVPAGLGILGTAGTWCQSQSGSAASQFCTGPA